MVAFTITPSRAAARLNSGVRRFLGIIALTRLPPAILFLGYWATIVLCVLYSLRYWMEDIPPVWFYAAFCFLPCLVSFLVCLLPSRRIAMRLLVAFIAFATLAAVIGIQMRLLVRYSIQTEDAQLGGLLSNFHVTSGTGFNGYVFSLIIVILTYLSLARIRATGSRA